MATRPEVRVLTATSVDILNAIRNSATQDYRNYVPIATADAESVKSIGKIIMQYPTLQNEFLNSLVNRIGKVIVTSKLYSNPWAVLKKGKLEFGETIEDVFVNIAKPYEYDGDYDPAKQLLSNEKPDVRSAFYVMNYTKYYPVTVSEDELRRAFMSWSGVVDLVSKIVETLYTSANYDEYQTMKYLIARHILDGHFTPATFDAETNGYRNATAAYRAASNKLLFMSNKNNMAGVATHTPREDQYLILDADYEAYIDVNVEAVAYNLEKATFLGNKLLIDGFGNLDIERLNLLFANDPAYVELGEAELEALNSVMGILIDKDFVQVYDNLDRTTEHFNDATLRRKYFYHIWRVMAVSPFANAVVFIGGEQTVTSVTVTPDTATVTAGQTLHLSAEVDTTNFASKAVTWSIISENNENTRIDNSGNLFVSPDESAQISVKVTSVFDTTKFAEATITVV